VEVAWPAAARRLTAEAAALRSRDCPKALDALGKRTLDREAALLQGFAAAGCRLHDLAIQRLGAQSAGELEDWRLWTLAQSQLARSRPAESLKTLELLLAEYPGSPLVSRALLEAARASYQSGKPEQALSLLEKAWRQPLSSAALREADVLTWEIARTRADRPRLQNAARRLLIDFPLEAARLQVADVLRGPDGTLDWRSFGTDALLRRAQNLVDAQIAAGALQTLDAVTLADRGVRWVALRARALTLDRQGRLALSLIDGAPLAGADPEDLSELAWARAQAAAEVMSAVRGRRPLAPAERAQLTQLRERALWEAAERAIDPGASQRRAQSALRLLAADLSAADRYGEALRAFEQLRQRVPDDLSGAPYLWGAAWREYRARRFAPAIDRWAALSRLYPESRYSRSGQYWTARAQLALGRKTDGETALRGLALADTNDFYRRHALARLGMSAAAAAQPSVRQAWPSEPAIERARLLSDLGLDEAALYELDATVAVDSNAGPASRAATALRGLILARQGERRESLRLLASAFPALGSANQADLPPLALELYYPLDYADTVRQLARSQGLPPSLVFGIIHQESAFDRKAISRAGARGLMQLMPPTARELSRKLRLPYSLSRMTDADFSVRLGTTYFRQVLEMFDGQLEVALAGYNAGPTRIRRLWLQGPQEVDTFVEDLSFDETKVYVKRILALSDSYKRLHPDLG
jgi:soluble lytic murein transglycosylase